MSAAVRSNGWIAWFARNPVAANLLMIAILALGLVTANGMRTEGFPEPAPRTINIVAAFQGASARDVEDGAAVKIEQALDGLEGIKEFSTTVTAHAATIAVTGVDGYDLNLLKDNIKARVDAINSFGAQLDTITITPAQEIDMVQSTSSSTRGSWRARLRSAATSQGMPVNAKRRSRLHI